MDLYDYTIVFSRIQRPCSLVCLEFRCRFIQAYGIYIYIVGTLALNSALFKHLCLSLWVYRTFNPKEERASVFPSFTCLGRKHVCFSRNCAHGTFSRDFKQDLTVCFPATMVGSSWSSLLQGIVLKYFQLTREQSECDSRNQEILRLSATEGKNSPQRPCNY